MAETSIAKTSLQITTDATGAKAGLDRFGGDVRRSMDKIAANTQQSADKIANEVEAGFHKTESKLNRAFGKFAKKEGGFLGFLGSGIAADLGIAGAAAGITGIVLATQQVIHLFDDWLGKAKEVAKAAEATRQEIEHAADAAAENARFAGEFRSTLPDPRERVDSFDQQISDLEKQRAKADQMAKEVLLPGAGEERKQWIARRADLDKQIRELLIQRNRAADPSQDPAFVGAINNATHALEEQAATWGKVGTEAQRALFKMRGATDEQLAGFDAAIEKLEKLRELDRDHAASVERSTLSRSSNPLLAMTGGIVNRATSFVGNPLLGFAANLSGQIADQIGARSGNAGFGFMLDTLFSVAGALPKPASIGDMVRDSLKTQERRFDNPVALAGTAAEFSARVRSDQRTLTAQEEKQLNEAKKQSELLAEVVAQTKATVGLLAGLQNLAPF